MTLETPQPDTAKKPWFKKWWIWLLIGLAALFIAAALSPTPEDEEALSPTTAQSASTTTVGAESITTVADTTTTAAATTTLGMLRRFDGDQS